MLRQVDILDEISEIPHTREGIGVDVVKEWGSKFVIYCIPSIYCEAKADKLHISISALYGE